MDNVNNIVNLIMNNDISKLEKAFDSVVKDRISDELELRKQMIGQSFGHAEEE